MRCIGWILGFMLSMGLPSAFAMEGGDFAPPVVLLDHQGIEKALDLENESSLLILFEAWNPAALNEYRAWTSSGTFDALGEIKAYWTSYGALREIGERAFDGSIPSTLFMIPISCSPNGIRSIAVPELTLSSGVKLWGPSVACPQKRGNHF